uniref:UBX domain-containing protein 6 n=1 Tax=Cacopsylla melanoneura TaxID=428564 RepID=A0A8D9EDK3_9HEMI
MADKVKKFFEKKKSDLKFKKAGPGHKLSDSGASSSGVGRGRVEVVQRVERGEQTEAEKAAAAAALARFGGGNSQPMVNRSHLSIQAEARKQIERERQAELAAQAEALARGSPGLERRGAEPVVNILEAAPVLAVSGVYFKCPLIGEEVLSRDEWMVKIKEFLYASLEDEQDSGLTACLIIRTINQEQDKVNQCVDTLLKYLKNILDHPDEEKYRKIRLSNRIFQERVSSVEGAREFLRAAGFQEEEIEGEQYLVYGDASEGLDFEVLMDALSSCEPVPLEVDRNPRVLRAAGLTCAPSLPVSFYERAPGELKREQAEKSEKLELEMTLRTKAMRERDEERGREHRQYKYCIVRVKFPDNLILQGTFSVSEPFSSVYSFVLDSIHPNLANFTLSLSGLKFSTGDNDRTLAELNLIPASILNFHCNSSVRPEKPPEAGDSLYLKPEVSILLSDS